MIDRSNVAPSSVGSRRQRATAASQAAPCGRVRRGRARYSNVVSSGAMSPARAPPSIDMLQIVMRCSIDSASDRLAAVLEHVARPAARPRSGRAARGSRPSRSRPGASRPSTRTSYVFGRRWSRHWVARTISTSLVPIPNASAPNAPWVEVCESPQTIVMPGCVRPSCGPMTWTMPWFGSPRPWSGMPNSRQLRLELARPGPRPSRRGSAGCAAWSGRSGRRSRPSAPGGGPQAAARGAR